jgi:hypothetical protein
MVLVVLVWLLWGSCLVLIFRAALVSLERDLGVMMKEAGEVPLELCREIMSLPLSRRLAEMWVMDWIPPLPLDLMRALGVLTMEKWGRGVFFMVPQGYFRDVLLGSCPRPSIRLWWRSSFPVL